MEAIGVSGWHDGPSGKGWFYEPPRVTLALLTQQATAEYLLE